LVYVEMTMSSRSVTEEPHAELAAVG